MPVDALVKLLAESHADAVRETLDAMPADYAPGSPEYARDLWVAGVLWAIVNRNEIDVAYPEALVTTTIRLTIGPGGEIREL